MEQKQSHICAILGADWPNYVHSRPYGWTPPLSGPPETLLI